MTAKANPVRCPHRAEGSVMLAAQVGSDSPPPKGWVVLYGVMRCAGCGQLFHGFLRVNSGNLLHRSKP